MTSKRLINKRKTKPKMVSEMNVVPYIDVMLVLLIIFMLTTPAITHSIEVNLPRTTNDSPSTDIDVEPLVVTVNENGSFYINNEKNSLTIEDVTIDVLAYNEKIDNLQVYIRGDRNTKYENVVILMNVLKEYGIEQVNLMTDIIKD